MNMNCKVISIALQAFGLDLSYLRGQCYDCTGNVSGATKGAAVITREQCPNATYIHCSLLVLNLAIAKACNLPNRALHIRQVRSQTPRSSDRNIQDEVSEEKESISRKTLMDCANGLLIIMLWGVHESSLPVAHPGYQVLSDILFRLGLIANALTQCSSQTLQFSDCRTMTFFSSGLTCFGTVLPFWC